MDAKSIKVLLIEDNPGDMRLMKEYLHETPGRVFDVATSSRMSEAEEWLKNQKPAVILSDLALPDASGFETVHRLRQLAPQVPLVVITGNAGDEALAIQALKEGVQDYLSKGEVNARMLSRVLRYAIERNQIEVELMQKTRELAHTRAEMEQLELFAFVASHDMREPLHKIISFSDMVKKHYLRSLDEKGIEYIERIQKTAEKTGQMFEQIRDLSRIATEGTAYEKINMKDLAREVVNDLNVRIKELNAKVEVDTLPSVKANRAQMYLVLQNLITNALKFHRTDTPPSIKIYGYVSADGMSEIFVQDNGIGFEEKYLDKIFKPFQRLHGKTEYEGSGIGLAICHKVILRHGGKITAKTTPGQGATFIFSLPNAN